MPNRTREFDNALLERVLPDVLWDEYGIAGDFVVKFFYAVCSHLC